MSRSRQPQPGVAGKTVMITGAARGIGAATAQRLAARGANLALVGLEPDRLAAVAAAIEAAPGGRAAWWEADVTDSATLEAAVAGAVRTFGGVDVLMANAGIANHGTIRTARVEEFARTVEVNLIGVYRTIAAALDPLTVSQGHVLIVASIASYSPLPGGAAYAASKAGVDSLAATLRLELHRDGITVGSAHPCWIDTDLVRGAEAAMPSFKTLRDKLPWPARSVTSVDACADALADAIAVRAPRVWVPRSAALISATRALIMNPKVQGPTRRTLAADLGTLDQEVTATRERVQPT
jgi:NAD(P)-dependent dehydrogenase (short-subunit alcohol dehydrogenase family)